MILVDCSGSPNTFERAFRRHLELHPRVVPREPNCELPDKLTLTKI
jgi:hypothetical protein